LAARGAGIVDHLQSGLEPVDGLETAGVHALEAKKLEDGRSRRRYSAEERIKPFDQMALPGENSSTVAPKRGTSRASCFDGAS